MSRSAGRTARAHRDIGRMTSPRSATRLRTRRGHHPWLGIGGAMSDRARRRWALVLFGLVVAADIAYVIAQRRLTGFHTASGVDSVDAGEVLGGLLTGVLGLVLTWLRPRNPIGWLITLAALALTWCNAGQAYGTLALVAPEKNLPMGELALSLSAPLWVG